MRDLLGSTFLGKLTADYWHDLAQLALNITMIWFAVRSLRAPVDIHHSRPASEPFLPARCGGIRFLGDAQLSSSAEYQQVAPEPGGNR